MHMRLKHTHVNTKRGKDEPLFITVDGPKEKCRKCQEEASLKEARSPKSSLQKSAGELVSSVSSGKENKQEAVMTKGKKSAKKAAAKTDKKVSSHRFAGHSIKVLNKEHGAREGTKRAKAMEILFDSKTTDDAIPKLEKIGADNSFIKFAVTKGFISLAAAA